MAIGPGNNHRMTDPRSDLIAREAARLIEVGEFQSIDAALRQASSNPEFRGAPLPSHGRVRLHAQAMSMQSLGEGEYIERGTSIWRIADEVMSTLELGLPDSHTTLMGRVADGHFDADALIHIRLNTRATIGEAAAALVEFGYDEPAFTTADTRHGRFDQLRFSEGGINIVITRVPPGPVVHGDVDLFSGKPVATLTLTALRQKLDARQARSQSPP